MTVTSGQNTEEGPMDIQRERLLVRRVTGAGPAAQLTYHVKKDLSTTSVGLGGPPRRETTDAALAGETVYGMRDTFGHWRLFLRGRTASNAQAVELAELEAYENRRWFLDGPVKPGQSWPIDPGFVRHVMKRDIGETKVEATATLQGVRMIDEEKTAVLTLKVATRGTSQENGKASGASISLEGVLHVALDTMLDKRLTLKGHMVTISKAGTQTTKVRLPMTAEVLKTVR